MKAHTTLLLHRVVTVCLASAAALTVPAACGDSTSPKSRDIVITIVSGDKQNAQVATPLPQPLTVRLADALGSPLRGVVVRFEDGGVIVNSAPSDASGLAAVRWTVGQKAGALLIRASVSDPNERRSVEFSATAVAGPAFHIQGPSAEALYAGAGAQLDTIRVFVRDRFDNPTDFVPVAFSVGPGHGSVRQIGSSTDALGMARAIWTLGETEGAQLLTVSSGSASKVFSGVVPPAFAATQVVTGFDHTCALTEGGRAYCWGANHFGQLGIGTHDDRSHTSPRAVLGTLAFKTLVAGAAHTCGLTAVGVAYCWGGNYGGQIGNLAGDMFGVPTLVPQAPIFTTLTAGAYHTCGLTSSGDAFCWGDNSVGQIGDGSQRSAPQALGLGSHPNPTRVVGSIRFSSIAASYYATCGSAANGEVYCWGENSLKTIGSEVNGRCGTLYEDYPDIRIEGEAPCSTSPIRVASAGIVASVVGAGWGMCAVFASKLLQCWGFNQPPSVMPNVTVEDAWVIWHSICGRETSGALTCWRFQPPYAIDKPFGDGLALVKLATSGRHTCGLTPSTPGKVYCWGSNFNGALGDGTTRHREHPATVVKPL
jgi:hypothetical protein